MHLCQQLCLRVCHALSVCVCALLPLCRLLLQTPMGSMLNHVLLHQTIIGEEVLLQLAKIGETPDLVVSCVKLLARPNKVVGGSVRSV